MKNIKVILIYLRFGITTHTVLETRKDTKDIGDNVAVCSRHFVNGDKRYLPTIIPRKVNGEIIWPQETIPRRHIRKQLSYTPVNRPITLAESSPTDHSNHVKENSPPFSTKLKRLHEAIDESPEKEVSTVFPCIDSLLL